MSSNNNRNNSVDDPLSALSAASEKLKDLEMRVCDVLTKQQEMNNDLNSLKMELTDGVIEESSPEESADIQFPEDYHFTEELKMILENLENSQKAWRENVKNMSKAETGIDRAASDVFKDMQEHLVQRLKYLEVARKLIEGPLVEEPPPPSLPSPEPEEPPEPEEEKKGKKDEKKDKKEEKKGLKDAKKGKEDEKKGKKDEKKGKEDEKKSKEDEKKGKKDEKKGKEDEKKGNKDVKQSKTKDKKK